MGYLHEKRALGAGRILILGLVLAMPAVVGAGESKTKKPASGNAPPEQFIIRLKPAHAEKSITEEEQAKISQHFEYLKGLLSEGKLLLAGLATDDYQGIVVIQAQDRLEAERIMASDPAVGANVFLAELHPFHVALRAGGK